MIYYLKSNLNHRVYPLDEILSWCDGEFDERSGEPLLFYQHNRYQYGVKLVELLGLFEGDEPNTYMENGISLSIKLNEDNSNEHANNLPINRLVNV